MLSSFNPQKRLLHNRGHLCRNINAAQDVHFSYNPEREVLNGVNIKAEPGQSIAIVGPSGSGALVDDTACIAKLAVIQLGLRMFWTV